MTGRRGVGLVAAVLLVLSGCGGEPAASPSAAPLSRSTPAAAYDPSLPPARAVLALVPHAAATLSVTDFDQVRAQYGAEPGDATFWKQATAHAPLLSTDMLRGYAGRLRGFTPDDVSWEARYAGDGPGATGWVLGFGPDTDMAAVQRAVADGIGPLKGTVVDTAARLVTSQAVPDTDPRWLDLADLVGPEAEATYVARGCLPGDTRGERLQPLDAYAIGFGQNLATVYLGPDREDLFVRMRLGGSVPAFSAALTHGAADPRTGRVGYEITDPVDAAQLALRGELPFAVCAD